MDFDHVDFVLPINHSGGIAVLWNNGTIHASVLFKDSCAIHMLIPDKINAQNTVVFGIYAPAQSSQKTQFYDSPC